MVAGYRLILLRVHGIRYRVLSERGRNLQLTNLLLFDCALVIFLSLLLQVNHITIDIWLWRDACAADQLVLKLTNQLSGGALFLRKPSAFRENLLQGRSIVLIGVNE